MPAKFKSCFACISVACCFLLGARPLRAAVQYSNLGPGDSYNTSIGTTIAGPQTPRSFGADAAANEFTAILTAPMTSVDVAIFGDFGPPSVTLVLYANDSLTGLPAAASMLTLGNVVAPGTTQQLVRLSLTAPVPLIAGANYWLGMLPVSPDASLAAWYQANDSSANPSAYSKDGGVTFVSGLRATAFRINSDPVPEPSTWLVCGVGFGLVGANLLRRKHAA